MPTNDTFAIRLLRAQSIAGVTQAQLAKTLGMHHETLGQYYKGESQPVMRTLINLSKALGVSTDYLCGLKEDLK